VVQSHVVSASVNKRAESWRDRSERAAARLEISLIATKPEFRRRDFARGLIHKAKRIAADSEVELVAHTENDISRDLFISERFSLVPEAQSVEGHPMYRFSGKQIEPR
jgi:ribosomal protein S18 acetylase RimI-like enzyme